MPGTVSYHGSGTEPCLVLCSQNYFFFLWAELKLKTQEEVHAETTRDGVWII